MAWMRIICGRLEMRYRYAKELVYNTFPWPSPTEEQYREIENTAKNILEVRKAYSNDTTMAMLYDPITMPVDLEKAHRKNDIAVMKAYGFKVNETSEMDCITGLMKLYHKVVNE